MGLNQFNLNILTKGYFNADKILSSSLSQFHQPMITYINVSSSPIRRTIIYGRKNSLLADPKANKESIDSTSYLQNITPNRQMSSNNNKTFRNYQSSGKISEKTIDFDYFRSDNKRNLREAIVNRSRAVLKSPLAAKSTVSSIHWTRREGRDVSSGDEKLWSMQQQSQQKTISLLVKAISRQNQLSFALGQDSLEIKANRPPIVWKTRRERRQCPLTKTKPQTPSPVKPYHYEHHPIPKYPIKRQLQAIKKQKPVIRGWDTIEFDQY